MSFIWGMKVLKLYANNYSKFLIIKYFECHIIVIFQSLHKLAYIEISNN